MKNFIVLLLIFIITALLFPLDAGATEVGSASRVSELKERLDYFGISQYNDSIDRIIGDLDGFDELIGNGMTFSDIVFGAVNGSLGLSFYEALRLIGFKLFEEVYKSLSIMRNIILIVILGAALKSLSSSFGESSIGEIGFYIIYIAIVSLLITSFVAASEAASGAVSQMAAFIHTLLPLLIALLAASGRYAVSFVFHPAAIGVIQVATLIINNIVMNVIILTAAVHMVNYMLPTGALEQMAELAGKVIGKGLKWIAVIFMSVISLQTAAAPIVGGVLGRGARFAVSSVPVVGQVFVGAVDSAYYWAGAVKNGVAAAAIIVVAFICFTPVIKLAAIAFIYKLTAALIQPVADERIVECVDAAGNYVSLFITAVMSVGVMFVALLMMVMAAAMG